MARSEYYKRLTTAASGHRESAQFVYYASSAGPLLRIVRQARYRTELVVVCSPELGARIRYRVAGNLYEMSPPPAYIVRDVIAELGRLAGLPDGAFPKEGIIDLKLSTGHAKWKIHMASADDECILTAIRE